MALDFKRNIEDFACEHCGAIVKGNGYTNHCPQCLWSKHVDVMPGDREATCLGLMRPTTLELVGGHYIINQVCQTCGRPWRNKASANDDIGGYLASMVK